MKKKVPANSLGIIVLYTINLEKLTFLVVQSITRRYLKKILTAPSLYFAFLVKFKKKFTPPRGGVTPPGGGGGGGGGGGVGA